SLFVFFSSRRRHTRFSRDWSSDVCSSDLPPEGVYGFSCSLGDRSSPRANPQVRTHFDVETLCRRGHRGVRVPWPLEGDKSPLEVSDGSAWAGSQTIRT